MKRFLIYERVSGKSQNLDSQHGELEAFATSETAKGNAVLWYTDKFTGKKMRRPGFDQAMKALRSGDTLVIFRLDRLARSAKGLIDLSEDFQKRNINLVSLRDFISLDTASGKLFFNILASVAQFETEVRSERIASANQTRRNRGEVVKVGRPKGSASKLTPDRVKLIHRLKTDGKPITKIAELTGVTRNTVYTALKTCV